MPIALVPDDDDRDDGGPRRIVVGIDDSEHATHALRWAMQWARADDEVSAVCAWEIPHGIGYDVPQFDPENLRTRARDTVHAAIEAVDGTGQIFAKIAEGDPRTVLRRMADDADLLVVGARGRTGLAHLALGSTTSLLIARPTVPVVVVP